MCAPSVIATVRDELSRRRFVGALGATVAAAFVPPLESVAQEKPLRLATGFRHVHDLTHVVSPDFPVYPILRPFELTERFTIAKDGFNAYDLALSEHTGTHMDAPAHFAAGQDTAERISPDKLFAPLAVVSLAARVEKDPDTTLAVDDLLAWEKQHGRLPAGAFVAMHSGWDTRVGDSARFFNKDANGAMHAPGFSEELALFLVKERDIVGVGVDTLSLDAAAAQKFVAHLALLGAGKYGIEMMANLKSCPPAGAMVIIGGPKHVGASGGPTRVFAVA